MNNLRTSIKVTIMRKKIVFSLFFWMSLDVIESSMENKNKLY